MKAVQLILSVLLILSLAACSQSGNGGSSVAAGSSKGASEASSAVEASGEAESSSISEARGPTDAAGNAGDLSLSVEFDREEYTLDNVIGTTVTVVNTSDQMMVYVRGSGSNVVPEALVYDLGGFAPMFKPEIMTMDFRVEKLEPGETLTYQCDFAPYIPKDERRAFGTDKDLSYFQTDEFTPAKPGTAAGAISFSYYLLEGGYDETTMLNIEDLEERSVGIENLEINIVETA